MTEFYEKTEASATDQNEQMERLCIKKIKKEDCYLTFPEIEEMTKAHPEMKTMGDLLKHKYGSEDVEAFVVIPLETNKKIQDELVTELINTLYVEYSIPAEEIERVYQTWKQTL
jgi:hypothetical protein